MRILPALLLALCTAAPAWAADEAPIAAFSSAAVGDPPAAWKFTTLPNKTPTKFSVVEMGGAKVLRVTAEDSYGNLVHAMKVKVSDQATLSWRWRVDKLIDEADLKVRSGEDAAAKVCVSFGFDAAKLPLGERAKLSLARSSTGEDVPTETLCYVWDNKIAANTDVVSAFTKRIRFMVLQSGSGKLGQWVTEKRNLAADHQRMFKDESEGNVPDVVAVAVGADADNTHGKGLAYVGDLSLKP
ncbi:MAG: DUF3047 domain-containing protein [Pseudomonadota bacterium]|jgi:hypothetical protein